MPAIKFSHRYRKMPPDPNPSRLLGVLVANRATLHSAFVEYDTAIIGGGNYPLPSGKVLVLLLQAESGELWTTIRRWTPDKEQYYRGLRGVRLAGVVS